MKSNVSFADIFVPIAKRLKDDDEDEAKRKRAARAEEDEDEDEDDDDDESKLKAVGLHTDDEDEDDEMDDDEKEARGVASLKGRKFKNSFADVLLGDPSRAAVGMFPLESQPGGDSEHPGRQPRGVDQGEDILSRECSDEIYNTLGGGLTGRSGPDAPIPGAGAGETYNDGIPVYRPQRFAEDGSAYIGGQTVTGGDFVADEDVVGHYVDREDVPVEGGASRPVRLPGGMTIMNAEASGIAPAAAFRAPGADTRVLKRAARSPIRRGTFRGVIVGPDGGGTERG